ncbi:glycosyltransferase [Polaribacter sp. KT 15]|uniref:glycosyltransferase family 2 protein n=1 Tax=Polaribacter sp. KT 15 TaxID=1896175 RepID=UPI00090C00BA|nr:glycosyltransferase [Polaribacter sp. KT 15]SHN09801.1 Glycosyltransferase involved in cell wall bisynthesis [Polaribacter sp. KT 15]
MDITNKLVSVVIPTYNREKYLEEAIVSVIDQTYKNFEIIIIDDGSDYKYVESICKKFENCYYYYKKNGGLSSARNYGIKKAKGSYIAFLDDDDFWRKDKLEKQVAILNSFSDVDCVHSSASVVKEDGVETGVIIGASANKAYKRTGYVFWNALGVWVVKSPTPLIRKKVFTKDLLFDETIKVGEDIDFYQRMFYRHKVVYIDEPLAYYREYADVKRLSLQKEKYIGIEKKMLSNFKKMGVKSLITILRIKYKLAKSIINKKGVKKSNLFLFLFMPSYYIK